MADLIEFLRQRLDEDERIARAVRGSCWFDCDESHMDHHERWDEVRVQREVEAKRRILDRHTQKTGEHVTPGICAECGGSDWKPGIGHAALDPYPWVMPWPCPTLRLLASVYADHPDYDESWRP